MIRAAVLAEQAGFDTDTVALLDAKKHAELLAYTTLIVNECIGAIDVKASSTSSASEIKWRQVCIEQIKSLIGEK